MEPKQIQFELTSEHLIVHYLNHYQYMIHHKNIIYFIINTSTTSQKANQNQSKKLNKHQVNELCLIQYFNNPEKLDEFKFWPSFIPYQDEHSFSVIMNDNLNPTQCTITSAMELDNFDVDIFGTFFIMLDKQLNCKNTNNTHPTRKIIYVNVEYLSGFYYYHNNTKYCYEFHYLRGYELKSCEILELAKENSSISTHNQLDSNSNHLDTNTTSNMSVALAQQLHNKIPDRTIELCFDRSKQTINIGTVDELNQILQKQKNKFHKKPCPNMDKVKFYHRACKMSKLCDIIEDIANSKV